MKTVTETIFARAAIITAREVALNDIDNASTHQDILDSRWDNAVTVATDQAAFVNSASVDDMLLDLGMLSEILSDARRRVNAIHANLTRFAFEDVTDRTETSWEMRAQLDRLSSALNRVVVEKGQMRDQARNLREEALGS